MNKNLFELDNSLDILHNSIACFSFFLNHTLTHLIVRRTI